MECYGARVSGGGNGGTVCVLSYGKEGKKYSKRDLSQIQGNKKTKTIFLFRK